MATSDQLGRFVWRDLVTPDVERAKAFYGQLFGWAYDAMPMPGGGTYWVVRSGGQMIGGVMATPPGSPAPPSWTSYVSVADVDASCRAFVERGARALVEPKDIPGGGRFAVIQDPEGAVLGLLRSGGEGQPASRPPAGTFCWETLSARDPARAKAFYRSLLGWNPATGPGGEAVFATAAGIQVADLQAARNGPASWVTYVAVDDVAASRSKASELGGRVVVPLVEIPKVGKMALIADPAGAVLALFQPGA